MATITKHTIEMNPTYLRLWSKHNNGGAEFCTALCRIGNTNNLLIDAIDREVGILNFYLPERTPDRSVQELVDLLPEGYHTMRDVGVCPIRFYRVAKDTKELIAGFI